MLAKAYQVDGQYTEAEKYFKLAWSWGEEHGGNGAARLTSTEIIPKGCFPATNEIHRKKFSMMIFARSALSRDDC